MGGSNKGQSSATTTQTPAAMGEYQSLMARLNQVGSQGYTPYGGELVAPTNQNEQNAWNQFAGAYGSAQPYINQAAQYATLGASPIQASAIQNYSNPYQDMVTNATMNQLQNVQQANNTQAMGSTLGGGGLFNDRAGVMQGQMANQESLANAQTLGGLNSQNYAQALAAAQGDRSAAAQAAYTFGNLGQEQLQTLLQGAQGTLTAGQLQQQQQQALDSSNYNQWQIQQAFPYQQLSWMAGLGTGIGSQMGGTSTTVGTPAQPNPWNQALGAGIFGLGAYNAYNQPTRTSARGGRIDGFAGGGAPEGGNADDWEFPDAPITMGSGAPKPPDLPKAGASGGFGGMSPSSLMGAAKGLGSLGSSALPYLMLGTGGTVHDFAEGGSPGGVGDNGPPLIPFTSAKGYIPSSQIHGGSGAPPPPKLPAAADDKKGGLGGLTSAQGADAIKGGKGIYDSLFGRKAGAPIDLAPNNPGPSEAGPVQPQPPLDLGGGGVYRAGGSVHGYADGGVPDDDAGTELQGGLNLDAGAFNPELNMGEFAFPGMNRINKGDREPAPTNVPLGASFEDRFSPVKEKPLLEGKYTEDTVTKPPDLSDLQTDQSAPALPTGSIPDAPMPRQAPTEFADASYEPTGSTGGGRGLGDVRAPEAHEQRSAAMGNALMTAGLGLMASRSPWLGSAIGEAGMAGLSAYSGTQKTEEAQRKEAHKETMDEKKYAQGQANITAREKRADEALAETKRYHDLQAQRSGWRATKEGGMEAVPGGPHDLSVIKAQAEAKRDADSAFTHDTVKLMADSIEAGNTAVLTNLGAGAMKSENVAKVWNEVARRVAERGGTGGELASSKANFNAQMAAAKTQAVRASNVEANIEEAKQTFPLALEASRQYARGDVVPWNRLTNMLAENVSDPKLKRLVVATQGAITAYTQAMARAGVATVHGAQSAEKLLSSVDGPQAFAAALDQMNQEMVVAGNAPNIVRERILARIAGKPEPDLPQTGAPKVPAGGAAQPTPPATAAPPPSFTGRTATGPNGQKLRETTTGQWVQ